MTHFWIRTAMIGASAAALAACATPQYPVQPGEPVARETPRPAYPIQPPAAEPDEGLAPPAQPTTGVESQPLPPPGQVAAPPPVETQPLAPLPEAAPPPPPPPPPAPVTRTRTVTSVTGKVVAAQGKPEVYTVKSGEGLDAIARKLDTTRKQLAEDNDLEAPYKIKPGQKLKGPAVKGKAYVVGQGDTLYAIAKRFSVKASALAEANGFDVDDPIRSGQKILLPSGFKDTGPITRTITETVTPDYAAPAPQPQPAPPVLRPAIPAAPPVYTPPAYTPPAYKPPVSTPTPPPVTPATPRPVVAEPRTPTPAPRPAAPSIITSGATPTDSEVAAAGRGVFAWPVQGDIASPFGPKGMGQRNDGLNIRAAAGSPVRSAAAGTVVYAGDQVPGFGNLVLVKHEGGWVTAYAHLARVDVKMQDVVMQGQQIGQVGSTGGVAEPQLHFEVRYAPSPKDKARPIDPALVLPK